MALGEYRRSDDVGFWERCLARLEVATQDGRLTQGLLALNAALGLPLERAEMEDLVSAYDVLLDTWDHGMDPWASGRRG